MTVSKKIIMCDYCKKEIEEYKGIQIMGNVNTIAIDETEATGLIGNNFEDCYITDIAAPELQKYCNFQTGIKPIDELYSFLRDRRAEKGYIKLLKNSTDLCAKCFLEAMLPEFLEELKKELLGVH